MVQHFFPVSSLTPPLFSLEPLSCAGDPRAGRRAPGVSEEGRAEGQHPLPRPAGRAAGDADQEMLGFLGCNCTSMEYVEFVTYEHPQVLLRRAGLSIHPLLSLCWDWGLPDPCI